MISDFTNQTGPAQHLMAARIDAHDWSTSFGHPSAWPAALRTLVDLMLASEQPMFVAWGPERILIYNDAYTPLLSNKHPLALGRPFLDVWSEVRPELEPLFDQVFSGRAVHMADIELRLNRGGRVDEAHFAFSYTPVRDDAGGVAGLFCACVETTDRVTDERDRSEATERLKAMFEQAPGFMAMLRGPDHVVELTNAAYMQLVGHREIAGKPIREALPDVEGQGFFELLDRVYADGEPFVGRAMPVDLQRTPDAPVERRFLDLVYQPITGADGVVTGIFAEGSDVTDRVVAETDLRESEERHRRINEGVQDHAIFTTDLSGRVTAWTPGAEAIFGWTDTDIIGRNVEVLFTPEDRAAGVPERELNIAEEKGCASDERWHVRMDGSRFFANGSTRPLHSANGDVAGFIKIARDETERRAVDARLRASEEFNRRVLASSADCIKVLDLDARLEFLSEGGMSALEVDDFSVLQGKVWFELWEGRERSDALAAVAAAKSGGRGRFQGFATTLKGSPRWWDVIVTPINGPDGQPERLLSISRDVTATRQAEDALRELNAELEDRVAERTRERNMLAAMVEKTDVMVMALDLDYGILAINKANADEFERIYGVRPETGDNILSLLADQPEQQAQVKAGWGRALSGEEVTVVEDYGDPELARPYYEIKWQSLLDDDGERIGAFQFVTDVTERRRAEAELLHVQEALRQSQKMEAMGQLTGGVAHDFNNLLTPIVGSLDMLLRRGVGNEREKRLIDGAMQSAERAKTLVQRLLAFARRQPLQAVSVDLGALVLGMVGLVESTIGPGISLQVDVEDELPPAKADPNQLEMAILNLGVNARDAMPDGGTLTIAVARDGVRRGHRSKLEPGHYLKLSVSDTGMGMDAETLRRAVEPFFSTKGVGKGTGLGLSMVHGLAGQLGGALTITSAPGEGTVVELWLAASREAFVGQPGGPLSSDLGSRRGSALLVDDEELVRMSTADMLTDLGYQVTEASSAEEAMRLLSDGLEVDIVVTDHLMPGMTGAELAQKARALHPDLPILLVSGYAEVEGVAPELPRLTKPFRNSELAAAIDGLGSIQ